MTIKSIALHDFRQFKGDQVVEFSTDPNRNVTLILGQNGAGKTTFAQAFKWCLYGDTDFMDKNVLNRKVADSLGPNENAEARVTLSLMHSGVPYEIIRSQKYSANDKGEMNHTYNTKLEVWRVAGDGNRQAVKSAELAVKEILPKGLSKYFFFDGERIRLMSEEVSVGKSAEFKDAVERLLGLSAIKRALLHLKEMRPTASVIRSYEKELNTGADKRIAECNDIIDKADSQLRGIENRDKELDKEIAAIESTIKTLENELVENKASEALAKEYEAQRKMLSNNESSKSAQIKQLLMSFNQNALSYLSRSLVAKCVEELSCSDVLDKGIPDVTAKTIAFLKKRGKCLCGGCLKEGTKEWAELEKLLEFVPPKSLGSFVNDFLDEVKRREKDTMGYFEEFSAAYNGIREIDSIIDECNDRIGEISGQLKEVADIAGIQSELESKRGYVIQRQEEKLEKARLAGELTNKREAAQSELGRLLVKNTSNEKLLRRKAYAERMYEIMAAKYSEEEASVRTRLQSAINSVFKWIYDGGMSLVIEDNYKIKVVLDDGTENVETSTAQSMSIIFAFIAGVIKMAKENAAQDGKDSMLHTEPYPLIMDAPLSNFDRTRVGGICDALPKIAEQVIFFSFDKDAEIAQQNMNEKIGSLYEFVKVSELETVTERRESDV